MPALHRMTPGEMAIIERSRREKNPSLFLNYFMRGPESGTWWLPVAPETFDILFIPEFLEMAHKWDEGYQRLLRAWRDLQEPDFFVETSPGHYETVTRDQYDDEVVQRKYHTVWQIDYETPTFHHNHGMMLLPWVLDMYRHNTEISVIVGGYGSGKSYNVMAIELFHCAIIKEYRSFGLAPFSPQSDELHRICTRIYSGTLFEKRFVIKSVSSPNPKIFIGNDYVVGKTDWRKEEELNGIEFYPILDNTKKVLTTTVDAAVVDQAEQLPDVDEALRDLSSRFRGFARGGRERLGQVRFLANSGDSPTLWDLYDEADTDPRRVFSANPGSQQNVYLGIKAMIRYQENIGRSETARQMHIFGYRPMGSGEHFPQASLAKCKSDALDQYMRDNQAREAREGVPDDEREFIRLEARRVSVFKWETPPVEGRIHTVIADPGWSNPPDRNSAAVSVWDITAFPQAPAVLVAFEWVFGNNSPIPWTQTFVRLVMKYKAVGQCRYDGTGLQKGYEYMGMGLEEAKAVPVNMGGNNKFTYLTRLKRLMAAGLIAMPTIPHIFSQLSKYTYPEPQKLRQDLVSMLLVLASLLMEMYYVEIDQTKRPTWDKERDEEYRYMREEDDEGRYGGTIREE